MCISLSAVGEKAGIPRYAQTARHPVNDYYQDSEGAQGAANTEQLNDTESFRLRLIAAQAAFFRHRRVELKGVKRFQRDGLFPDLDGQIAQCDQDDRARVRRDWNRTVRLHHHHMR